jgi:hypothetical protein
MRLRDIYPQERPHGEQRTITATTTARSFYRHQPDGLHRRQPRARRSSRMPDGTTEEHRVARHVTGKADPVQAGHRQRLRRLHRIAFHIEGEGSQLSAASTATPRSTPCATSRTSRSRTRRPPARQRRPRHLLHPLQRYHRLRPLQQQDDPHAAAGSRTATTATDSLDELMQRAVNKR